jgi:PAS domain S-box-containing protein
MKIRTVIYIVLFFLLVASISFGVLIGRSLGSYRESLVDETTANEIVKKVLERRLLADDYILNPSERSKSQWYAQQKVVEKLVASHAMSLPSSQEKALIDTMKNKFGESRRIFGDIITFEEKQASESSGLESHQRLGLAGQLTVKTQETIAAASQMAKINKKEAEEALQRMISLFSVVASLFLAMVLVSFSVLWKSAGDVEREKQKALLLSAKDEAILASIGDGVFVIDRNGKIIVFNRAASEISHFAPGEAVGEPYQKILTFVHENDPEKVSDSFIKQALGGFVSHMDAQTVLIRKDGEKVPIADSAAPIFNEEGVVEGVVVVFRDVTAESALTRRLQEEQLKDKAIIESIGDGVIITDEYAKVLRVNNQALRMLGFTREEMMGRWIIEALQATDNNGVLIPPQKQPITEALATGEIVSETLNYVRKNKSTFPVGLTVAPLLINDTPIGTVLAFRDITREKELDRLKDEFVSIASHELRTPMTAIKGLVSMIFEGDYGALPPDLKEPLTDVYNSTTRLIHLVNDMLNISRIEAGRLRFTITDFRLTPILKEITSSLAPIARDKHISLSLKESTESTDMEVTGDINKVKQILNNIVGNSLKFTDHGGILLSCFADKGLAKIYIADTGAGIAREDQKKLFGKFQQVAVNGPPRPSGTGLGLYISRELASRMGGDLWIEYSEVGKGSVFALTLPLKDSEKAREVYKALKEEARAHPDQTSMT